MKRKDGFYALIPTYENLLQAFYKAAKGKQDRKEVIEFRQNLDVNLNRLQDQIENHDLDIGNYRFFKVKDPKPRHICAAPFPERILHHAIMNICEPVLDAYAIYDSYACRKGKGTQKAILRAQAFSKRFKWYLKLDIRKYFDSIDHDIMLQMLSHKFKDKQLIDLFRQILETYETRPGKGIPIGNHVSQHLANFYLGFFDHWIKEELKVKGYLRYMDDSMLFSQEKNSLKTILIQIETYLKDHPKLTLKDNIALNRVSHGIPFLGYHIFPDKIRLSKTSRKRFVHKFKSYEEKWQNLIWSTDTLVKHIQPLIDFTKAANAFHLRRKIIKQFGVLS